MPACEVRVTRVAEAQINALRASVRSAAEDFLTLLTTQGCAAMGYRLSGSDVLERLCVKHLRAAWRVVVAFPRPDEAVVLVVGEHTQDPGRNLYDTLYEIIGHQPAPTSGRNKPPCCDDDAQPPLTEQDQVDALADRIQEVFRGRRRRG